MGLFSKPEYLEVVLPFIYEENSEDAEACVVSIEAYGRILDEDKYYYASFHIGLRAYDELSELLMTAEQKFVTVIAKVKNGVVKDFKIDLNDIAERFHDERFKKLSLVSWGLNDKSFQELEY